ncbi:MAG: hypothetical protein ABI689_05495 [Thermoanaerobaculia bacterium]
MNVWIPGLIVVSVGLAAGLWYALRGKHETLPEGGSKEAVAAPAAGSPAGVEAPIPSARRSSLVGFLAGVASCLVIGGLIYWATEGSKPKQEMGGGAPAMGSTAPMAPMGAPGAPSASPEAAARAHDESADLTPEIQAQLQQSRGQVQAAPQDLNARRQLAVALLNANQLMEAFEQARELQKVAPDDPDGLFVEGVVRLAMGQWPLAVQLMDKVLAQHADHVLAALAKGQAEAALGQTPAAIATWKKGLAAAGGKFPPIEELLAQAEGGAAMPEGIMAPPPTAEAAATAGASGGSYRIHIELAPGAVGPRGADGGATLFVALRGDAPGPPAAVKRISNPSFPLELTLSADDSMVGQPLPATGALSIHLDGDGNASTLDPGDLTAAVKAFSGTPVTVILEP